LLHWRQIRVLDVNASQGQLFETSEGRILLSYEKDAPQSCWIRVQQFESLDELIDGEPSASQDIERSLAPTAEGTPMVESVEGDSGEHINVRFHFFQDAHVDRLARGRLTNFSEWKSSVDEELNAAFEELGESGNFGSRTRFRWGDETWCLQEIQEERLNWRSWGVYLCTSVGTPIERLAIRTHKGSQAFCNPHVEQVRMQDGQTVLIVTMFLPHEGSKPGEAGELIYLVPTSPDASP